MIASPNRFTQPFAPICWTALPLKWTCEIGRHATRRVGGVLETQSRLLI